MSKNNPAFNKGMQQNKVTTDESARNGYSNQGQPASMEAMVRGAINLSPADSSRAPGGAPALVQDPYAAAASEAKQEENAAAPKPDQMTGSSSSMPTMTYTPEKPAIGKDEIRKARHILKKYKDGKRRYENTIVNNEKWYKMRHWDLLQTEETMGDPKPASGWLFNCIISKHADFMDSFPGTNILPRESGDRDEAQRLSSIVPVVMEQNGYEDVYSQEIWYKLKHGTGVFGVFWDQSKLNGLGDISIQCMDILNLFWEPGVSDIQKSANLFNVELVDNDALYASYPDIRGKLKKSNDNLVKKYFYDENIDTTGKSAVVDWYYKKNVDGKEVLHYCKFVEEEVLYATENDTEIEMETHAEGVYDEFGNPAMNEDGSPAVNWVSQPKDPEARSMAERGLYDHGQYPFVFDVLFPEPGMPTGFGFIHAGKNAQTSIDVINNAFEKNIQFTANPRYFSRIDGSINEEEFMDPNKLLIHTDGQLGEDSIRQITPPTLVNSNYINLLDQKINEMKETLGNRDTSNGGAATGVTAASAIAAMQESSGKTSRDQIKTSFRAHEKVAMLVIELIRQFYDMPRSFRITGSDGNDQYVTYSNEGLQPQYQGNDFGVDMGYRLPVFDIKVEAEKESAYSKLSQNELALQFYNSGFFNPQYTDQVLACLDMMEFQGKQDVVNRVSQNGGMYQQMMQMQQQILQLSQIIDQMQGSNLAEMAAADINGGAMQQPLPGGGAAAAKPASAGESSIMTKSRERAAATTQPR